MVNETTTPGKNGLANIFRQQAIDALNTVNEIETELKIISPSSWLGLFVCLLLLIGVAIWGLFGKITLMVEAPGIVLSAKQITEAETAIKQTLNDKQEKLAEVSELYNSKLELYKKHYLTRIDILRAKDEYITARNDFLESKKILLPPMQQYSSKATTTTLAFVNYLQGKRIHPGLQSDIIPVTSSYKRINATVISISERPITKQLANFYLQNRELVDAYFAGSTPYLVKLQFNADTIPPGTAITAHIIYKKCSPIQLLVKSFFCE